MRLIGMMDSPYVRRVAISLGYFGLPFSHEPLSVFRQFDAFASINPVVKAPTLVTADGLVLMDSTLILEYLERLAPPERRLMPADMAQYTRAQRITGLALAACEKAVQIFYEYTLRPPEKQHQPWIDRVQQQLLAAWGLLEAELGSGDEWLIGPRPLQADVTTAVVWRFTRSALAEFVDARQFAAVCRFSEKAEALPEFLAAPFD